MYSLITQGGHCSGFSHLTLLLTYLQHLATVSHSWEFKHCGYLKFSKKPDIHMYALNEISSAKTWQFARRSMIWHSLLTPWTLKILS